MSVPIIWNSPSFSVAEPTNTAANELIKYASPAELVPVPITEANNTPVMAAQVPEIN